MASDYVFHFVDRDRIFWSAYHGVSFHFDLDSGAFFADDNIHASPGCIGGVFGSLGLPFYGFQSPVGEPNTRDTGGDKEAIEYPEYPIGPVPSDRHGRKFADSYRLRLLFGLRGIARILCLRCEDLGTGLPPIGGSLISSGIPFDATADTARAMGWVPWEWGDCLQDGQEHSEQERLHTANTVPPHGIHSGDLPGKTSRKRGRTRPVRPGNSVQKSTGTVARSPRAWL